MVVVKQGDLPPPGKHYRLYLNADRKRNKWYLRVTHSFPHTNRHFRAGTYDSKEEALKAAEILDPINPKKGRSKPGTVDRYSNGMWRVRVKYKGEHMHVGYYRDENLAKLKLQEALADPPYLEERYQSLLAKRRRKTYAKLEKKKRKCESMEAFDQFDPLAKRLYQRQNIISPISDTNLPKLCPASSSSPSVENYNAFLLEHQNPCFPPDYGHLYHTFLTQEKVKQERSFCHTKPLKTEFSRNEPLEWCQFSPKPLQFSKQTYSHPLERKPPSFKATINLPAHPSMYPDDPTSRYLQSTIPEPSQQPAFQPQHASFPGLQNTPLPAIPFPSQLSSHRPRNNTLPTQGQLNELANILSQDESKLNRLYPFLDPFTSQQLSNNLGLGIVVQRTSYSNPPSLMTFPQS